MGSGCEGVLIFKQMKSFFFCFTMLFCVVSAMAQTNELWYKNWQNPFLVLFEEDTFDVAESRLFLPYRIFESSKKKVEIVYNYTNYKQKGYYRCIYQKGKLKSRVLYLDYYSHTFPWSVFVKNGKTSAKREKLRTPLKQVSYFTHFTNGRVEEKAFRADTFLQTVNYFMANGRIDSVKISKGAYSLNYRVTYDALGRLLVVQAVENGKSYVAQKRIYNTYNYYYVVNTVEDTLFGYSAQYTTSVASNSIPQKAFFVDYAKDTSYLFAASHTLYDKEYIATYGIYKIQNGTFLETKRSYDGRCSGGGTGRISNFPTYTHTKQDRQGVTFVKKIVANKRFETFCPEPFYLGGDYAWSTGGYALQRREKMKGRFSVYSIVSDQSRNCDDPVLVDSNKIMEVVVR